MATAESIKAKIQGLIDSANNTTGKADTDMTAAVASLIDGFGQGGGGTGIPDTAGWVRPSNWPDLDSLGKPEPGTVYLTYDCRDTISGVKPGYLKIILQGIPNGTLDRGKVENGTFVPVKSIDWGGKKNDYFDELPTDEGDFVVYRLMGAYRWGFVADSSDLGAAKQPCVEVYGTANGNICSSSSGTYSTCMNVVSFVLYGNSNTGYSVTQVNKSKLERIHMDDWNGSGTYSVAHNQNLKKVSFPSSAIAVSCQDCNAIEEVDVSKVNFSGTSLQHAFNGCTSLKRLNLAHFNTSKVTNFNYVFVKCYSLYDLDFSGLDTSAMASNASLNMFQQCTSLTNLKVGKITVNFKFTDCNSLSHESLLNVIAALEATDTTKTLTIGSTNLAKLTADEIAVATGKGWTVA